MLQHRAQEPRFTYGDYVQWEGDERWELIDGSAVAMSPAPNRRHQDLVLEAAAQIREQVEAPCRVYVAPFDVRLPKGGEADDEIDTVVQPDVSVICDPGKLDRAGCRGAPDWILEILSPATAARDQVQKRDLYERHGVREYWVVDPVEETVTLYSLDSATGRYREPRVAGADDGEVSPAHEPAIRVDLRALFESV